MALNVKPRDGDRVHCNVRGRRFWATVTSRMDNGDLQVEPDSRGITYYRVTLRQVEETDRWDPSRTQVR